MSTCYSAPSRFLLRGAPDYSADTEAEFHADAHEQLRMKDFPRVPTRRLEVDSNPQPSGCKAPNIPLHHRAPHWDICLQINNIWERAVKKQDKFPKECHPTFDALTLPKRNHPIRPSWSNQEIPTLPYIYLSINSSPL